MSRPALSVVIPAYNESPRLESTLDRVVDYLGQRREDFEILVVDDGSSDATADLAADFHQDRQQREASGQASRTPSSWSLRVLANSRNRGKGYSVRRGMLEAQGHYALLSDADLSTPIAELAKLEEKVRKGPFLLAFGSRGLKDSRVEIPQNQLRKYSGRLFNRTMRLLTGLPFHDTQCGFKLFEMRHCRPLFELQRLEGFGFDVEILYLARKKGLRMAEIPVIWRNAEGTSVNLFSGLRAVWDLIVIRYYDWKGRYQVGS
ncbi:MAG TPA: dolichyl-phosphate beta-glucosyltransferase [Acidobacteriota bacterium]|nr:dolichyl-phosphate beta-glucosyltransferase [Acidobacteriota bacterium]